MTDFHSMIDSAGATWPDDATPPTWQTRWPTPLKYSDLDWIESRDSGQTFIARSRRRTA